MNEIVKPAFVRWLSDLMKADNIIAPDEISFLEDMCRIFSISEFDIEKAQSISLAQACDIMKANCKERMRNTIVKHIKQLSINDGACAREEALLILALSYSLDANTINTSKVVSFRSPHIDFVDSQVLFIEPSDNTAINQVINRNHKTIVNDMRIGGFDFIYIPQIARHYREMDPIHLSKIIKYLAPTLTQQETDKVHNELSQMTTRTFYNEILKEKLGIDVSINSPSILIKIGNSYVSGERVSNFLLMEVKEDIPDRVRKMVDIFLDYQRCSTITIKNYNEIGGNFIYTGFYKTIFDLVTYRRGMGTDLIFHHNTRPRIKLKGEGGEGALEMGLAATAFYEFLIIESLSKNKGVTFTGVGRQRKNELRQRFANIYYKYKGHQQNVPDITDPNTRNPLLVKIRKAIRECGLITEKRSFLPNTDTSKIFVSVDSHHVLEADGKKEHPIFQNIKP